MIQYRCRGCKGRSVTETKSNGWIEHGRAMGPCPHCGGFYRADVVRVRVDPDGGEDLEPIEVGDSEVVSFGDAQLATQESTKDTVQRIVTGWRGVDYVFGGGIKTRAAFLLCGGEGSGKSTFIIELFRHLAKRKVKSLYINVEQSVEALCEQHERLGKLDSKYQLLLAGRVGHELKWPGILRALDREEPEIAAIDSLHAIEGVVDDDGIGYATGGDSAIGQIGRDLKKFVDGSRCAMLAVGHLNVDGTMAGGKMVRYILDGKLRLRRGAAKEDPMRYLETDGKLRHGRDGRRCRLEMLETGMRDRGPLPFVENDGPDDTLPHGPPRLEIV